MKSRTPSLWFVGWAQARCKGVQVCSTPRSHQAPFGQWGGGAGAQDGCLRPSAREYLPQMPEQMLSFSKSDVLRLY